MNVELPTTGCNILRSDSSFYNYSADAKTRETYYIYDGQAKLSASDYNQYGYNYTGTCLETGDLVYHPEIELTQNLFAFIMACVIIFLIAFIFVRKFWRVLR